MADRCRSALNGYQISGLTEYLARHILGSVGAPELPKCRRYSGQAHKWPQTNNAMDSRRPELMAGAAGRSESRPPEARPRARTPALREGGRRAPTPPPTCLAREWGARRRARRARLIGQA